MVAVRLLLGSMTPAHERKEDPAHERRAAGDGAGRVLESRKVEDSVVGGSKCAEPIGLWVQSAMQSAMSRAGGAVTTSGGSKCRRRGQAWVNAGGGA
jgi:hypothetical protein